MSLVQKLLNKKDFQRKIKNKIFQITLYLFFILAVTPLFLLFVYVIQKGLPSLTFNFFTQLPAPVGEPNGGMANALLGSLILLVLAGIVGVPLGLSISIYLSEYKHSKIAHWLRLTVELFLSVPSIVVGLFTYAFLVQPFGGFSAYAGGFALMVILLPFVARAGEEILKLVPNQIREAGLALGLPRWKVILFIVLRTAKPGLLTAIVLALARVSGETAPLLFTAFGNHFHIQNLNEPIASLPVQIYEYSKSPFEEWQSQAWGGALVLIFLILTINLLTRFFFSNWSLKKMRNT